jgi:hypothetical protein
MDNISERTFKRGDDAIITATGQHVKIAGYNETRVVCRWLVNGKIIVRSLDEFQLRRAEEGNVLASSASV